MERHIADLYLEAAADNVILAGIYCANDMSPESKPDRHDVYHWVLTICNASNRDTPTPDECHAYLRRNCVDY